QVKHCIKKYGDTDKKTTTQKGNRCPVEPCDPEGRADNFFGCPTFQHRFSNDRCHSDQDPNFSTRFSKSRGYAKPWMFRCQLLTFRDAPSFCSYISYDRCIRCENCDHKCTEKQGQKGM